MYDSSSIYPPASFAAIVQFRWSPGIRKDVRARPAITRIANAHSCIQYKARRCCHMIERDLFETQKVMWEIFARSQSAERGQCRTSSTLTFLLRFGGCRQDSHAAVWIAVLDEPAHVSRLVPLEAHL